MNIFAHFKDIESESTQDRIHNKLFLLVIDQFQCYYHQCDCYIQRSIERVAMDFLQNVMHVYQGHDFLSVFTHCIIVLYIERCNV